MIRAYLQSVGRIAELQIMVERRCMPILDVLWCRVAEPVHSSNVRQHWQQNCTAAAGEGCPAGHQMNQKMLLNKIPEEAIWLNAQQNMSSTQVTIVSRGVHTHIRGPVMIYHGSP